MIIIRQAKKEDFEVQERLYNELEEDAVLYHRMLTIECDL